MIEGDPELRALMIRYQGGSLDAFQELYAQFAPELRRYLLHLANGSDIADDLLQETFLQMHRSRAAYNPAYAVRPWAFGLARNVFLMNRRAARRFAKVHQLREDLPEFSVLPEADKLGAQDEIRQCIAHLAPDRVETLLLHHQWGFSFEEIAGMLGITSAAARARASRAMADLRVALNGLQNAQAARQGLQETNNSGDLSAQSAQPLRGVARDSTGRESVMRRLLKRVRA